MNITPELHALGFTNTLASRIEAKILINDAGCHEWQGAKLPSGYGRVGRGQRNRGAELAHRAVWMLKHGPIQAGMVIRHSCDNPCCCNIDHLAVGTQADNLKDMQARGRANYLRGEKASSAKLTDAQVVAIRALPGAINNAQVGAKYGVSGEHIRSLRLGLRRAS